MLKTRIYTLDRMLGADSGAPPEVAGEVVLLRGAPGSGKTTLGLEILARHLLHDTDAIAAFVSLEVAPDLAISAVKAKITDEAFSALDTARKTSQKDGNHPRLFEYS